MYIVSLGRVCAPSRVESRANWALEGAGWRKQVLDKGNRQARGGGGWRREYVRIKNQEPANKSRMPNGGYEEEEDDDNDDDDYAESSYWSES